MNAGAMRADGEPDVAISTKDIVVQLYTSGTTGRPKGAMLAMRIYRHTRIMKATGIAWNVWTADDVSLVAMPVSHIGGTGWGLMGLYHGAKSVVAREFNPHAVLDFIEKEQISKMFLVPAAIQIVLRDPRARTTNYSRMKFMIYGASPIPLDLLREGVEVFGCGFVQMYGMTETTGTIVALPPEDHKPEGTPRMRAAGKPLPNVEIAILDEAGNNAVQGQRWRDRDALAVEHGGILEIARGDRGDHRWGRVAAHGRCGIHG